MRASRLRSCASAFQLGALFACAEVSVPFARSPLPYSKRTPALPRPRRNRATRLDDGVCWSWAAGSNGATCENADDPVDWGAGSARSKVRILPGAPTSRRAPCTRTARPRRRLRAAAPARRRCVHPGLQHQVDETHRPVLLTSRGRGVAVLQALTEYEAEAEERSFLRAVVEGIVDLEEGRELDLADVKQRLGLR